MVDGVFAWISAREMKMAEILLLQILYERGRVGVICFCRKGWNNWHGKVMDSGVVPGVVVVDEWTTAYLWITVLLCAVRL